MDRGGCQMSGGGGGGGDPSGPAQPGMITLEDLESFSEEVSDSGNGSLEEEGETMEEDEGSDRLLHYWQDVARGHQVEVAQGKNNKKHDEEKTRHSNVTVLVV